MRRKWDADVVRNLTKRGQTYYYRTDFKDSTGKRHAFRRSLHTSDFYTAVGLLKNIKKQGLGIMQDKTLSELWKNMPQVKPGMTQVEMLEVEKQQREIYATIERRMGLAYKPLVFTSEEARAEFYPDNTKSHNIGTQPVPDNNTPVQVATQSTTAPTVVQTTQPQFGPEQWRGVTARAMFEEYIKEREVKIEHYDNQNRYLKNFLATIGAEEGDDFGVMCSRDAVKKICEWLKQSKRSEEWKYKGAGFLKRLLIYAKNYATLRYDTDAIGAIYKFRKNDDMREDSEKGHQPFEMKDLKKLFSPKHDLFDRRPDWFWVFLIALYTAARRNAAVTLLYGDIREKSDIKCIAFVANNKAKHLKTSSTIRTVPIHPQLLELGFWEFVQERKQRLNASDDDFLFPSCISATGEMSTHFSEDIRDEFLAIGIKKTPGDGKSFHSFRNTASLTMIEANIHQTKIKKIVGWKGESTMEEHYAKLKLKDMLKTMNEYNYDELMPDFRYWATRIRERERAQTTA